MKSKPHVLSLVVGWFCAVIQAAEAAPAEIDFGREVRPILDRCIKCHGPDKQQGGLRFDVRTGALRAGDSGSEAIKPSDAARSELIRGMEATDESERMPPEGERLSREQIKSLRAWIDQGARWPKTPEAATAKRVESAVTEEDRQHWSYRPLGKVEPPRVKDDDWCATTIDRFVLATLEAKALRHNQPADQRTLIRRVYFDLIGLPPSLEQVDAFVANDLPLVRTAEEDRQESVNIRLVPFAAPQP